MADVPVHRPSSIRSVASNSSIASGVSLSRRARTRARSRTVTGAPARPNLVPPSPVHSDLPYLVAPLVQEPESAEDTTSTQLSSAGPPPRPPRSPDRLEAAEIRSSDTASSQDATNAEATFVEPLNPPVVLSKKPSRPKVVPLDTGYKPPPSAFSRDPALTPVVNVRDSVSTQQSGVSSSLYPPSTSTASGPTSPTSPQSMAEEFPESSFVPEVREAQEYDGDDVAYRLRLLVNNSYFLPPAHAKPSPQEFTPLNPPKKGLRSTAPTFLDIFRVGKSKSKPTTPTGPTSGFDPNLPMLRTTGDSIAPSYAFHPQQPRSSSQVPRLSPQIPSQAPRGRVVVVREKMNDIAVAAKQAEQDLKSRAVRNDQGSQKAKPEVFDDIIDPTDAVDIPLPSPNYPFAVQASALHGLGVLESVGADVLADRLPPSKSPNMSSTYDPIEDSWRKALLHEAVHHSLDNTPDVSTFSHILGASTPLGSPRVLSPEGPSRNATPHVSQKILGQRILAQPMIDDIASTPTKIVRRPSNQSHHSTSKGNGRGSQPSNLAALNVSPDASRPSSYLPQRVDTPSGPMTPLAPPPRRHFVNPVFSQSQTNLGNTQQSPDTLSRSSQGSHPVLRRAISSPSLAEGYESYGSRPEFMTPPPLPNDAPYSRDSQATTMTFDTVRGSFDPHRYNARDSHIHETDYEAESRASFASRSRPSLSEYSQSSMSPTTSAFQEMLNNEDQSSSSVRARPSRFSIDQAASRDSASVFRYSAMSPPPRISSSLAHVALPPPPRSSSLQYRIAGVQRSSSDSVGRHGPNNEQEEDSSGTQDQILPPEPTTPIAQRRGVSPPTQLSLDIPPSAVPVQIHSAPGPSSPTSFFDSIQTQPNAMDDLDSSSDEEEDAAPHNVQPPPKLFVDPRSRAISSVSATNPPRPTFMKLGNFSAPYLRGETPRQNHIPVSNIVNSKRPVGNIAAGQNDATIPQSYDFYRYAQEHNPPRNFAAAESSRQAQPANLNTAEQVTTWRNNQQAQDSLRKLDGMLLQHMEDEKEAIKRIATTMKQTTQPSPSPLRQHT